ncbi:MAG: DUF3817 domain-containing protein [Thermomicrobiales bacterium]
MSALKAFAWIAIIEGTSWILLIVAMIFKYGTDVSWGTAFVRTMGQIHGFLFLLFVALLALNHVQRKWPIQKTLIDFFGSLVPGFGYWIGKQALAEDAATASPTAPRA